MFIGHFNVTNLALEIGILSGNNRLVHHCVLDLWRATCVNYKTRQWKIIFQLLNLFRSNIFRRTTTIIILQWYGMGWDLLWVCYRACFTTELQLDEKCFSRVLLSYDKNSCTHFPRSFLSVAQRSGAGVEAAGGPSQPSWLQIHLSENMTF